MMTLRLILHRQIRSGSCPGVQAEPEAVSGTLSERNAPGYPVPLRGQTQPVEPGRLRDGARRRAPSGLWVCV